MFCFKVWWECGLVHANHSSSYYNTHQPNRDNLTTTKYERSMQSKLKENSLSLNRLTKKDTEDGSLLSKLFLTSFWQNDARKMWHVGLLSARADSTTCVVFRHASIHLWFATQKMINQWGLKLYVMPYIVDRGAGGQYENIAQVQNCPTVNAFFQFNTWPDYHLGFFWVW